MTEENKEKLIAAGRKDLVDIYELNQSGYAGVNQHGTIVDRRKIEHANALSIPENSLLGIPPARVVAFCMFCDNWVGFEPQTCCSGRDCGCMGQPVEPLICPSEECYAQFLKMIDGNKNN